MSILTSDWMFDALICTSIGVFIAYVYLTRNFSYWKKLGVKQQEPTVLFGNAADCIFGKKNPNSFYQHLYKIGEGEKMIGFYIVDKPFLLIRDPELIKDVLIKDFNYFTMKIMCGNNRDKLGSKTLFLVENPPWKHIRSKLTPMFTSGRLKKTFDLMIDICKDFENYLDNLKIDKNIPKSVDVRELCGKLTTDIIGITSFGMRLNSLTDPDAEFRRHGRRMFRSSWLRYLQMLSIFFIPPLRPFVNPKFFDDQGTEFLRSIFWNVMNEREKSKIKRNDLIDILLDIKENQEKNDFNGYKLDDDELVAQAAVFFTAGFETSSTTISFALYELAKNPDIQMKLRDEILEELKKTDGKVTYELVTTLPYLHMVIQETLRMYPILSWIDRTVDTDYTFKGTNVTIKKGISVVAPMSGLHMDSKYFANPEKFDPERFSEENKNNITPYTYFPFGEGPRNCIGARLGLIQTKLGVIYSISKYELSPSKETPIPIKLDTLNVFAHTHVLPLNFRKI